MRPPHGRHGAWSGFRPGIPGSLLSSSLILLGLRVALSVPRPFTDANVTSGSAQRVSLSSRLASASCAVGQFAQPGSHEFRAIADQLHEPARAAGHCGTKVDHFSRQSHAFTHEKERRCPSSRISPSRSATPNLRVPEFSAGCRNFGQCRLRQTRRRLGRRQSNDAASFSLHLPRCDP